MVENLVQIELAYINTKHPDFHEASLIQRALNSGDLGEKAFENKASVGTAGATSSSSISHNASATGQGQASGNLRASMTNLNINGNDYNMACLMNLQNRY